MAPAKRNELKHSRQRERILEILRSTDRHPTAAWLYHEMQREFSNLSMGTVYRNLNILMEQGLIQKHAFGSTFDHFEAKTEPHYHFICERCGRIIDLDIPVNEALDEQVRRATSHHVRQHKLQFFGICDQCRAKENAEEKRTR